jgi:signal transduction histidine kinase/ActR/RegA family two-component response regulator
LDQTPESIPFLSTAPPARRDKIAAILLIAASLAILAAVLRFAETPWPLMAAFVPADDTGLALIYFITAMLLIGQFVQLRLPSLVVLSSGYFFACFVVICHLLSYAQVLRALFPETANDQTTAWLYITWHGIFPISVLAYALTVDTEADRPVERSRMGIMIAASVIVAFAMTALSAWIAIDWSRILPALVQEGSYSSMIRLGISPAVLAVGLVTLAALWLKTRGRRVLDLWLCIVMFAWLLDVLVGAIINRTPFTFGWYAARIYSLLAAAVVLSSMLMETGELYARLTRTLSEMRAQSAALSKSEAAFRQAQKMEAIGQITGGVAHDFNNLLTVIVGSLDMLRRRVRADDRAMRLTDYALEAAVRGERLTKQLLAFSRRQMLNPETVSVDRLIEDFEGLLARAVGGGVRIDLSLAATGAFVHVDPAQFEAAMLNLAVNARDAMDGMGTLAIETRATAIRTGTLELPTGQYVAVSVTDTGAGMDEETVAHAFEPFFTTKPVGQGSGLGLSQVYGFIKSAGGHVAIDSIPGAGTVVRLYFPRASGEQPDEAPAPRVQSIAKAGRGERILVVEDDVAVLDMAAETLREVGYVVEGAADGEAALRKLENGLKVDLVFSDIVMPGGLSGIDLAREARRIRPSLKILLTSGYAGGALNGASPLPTGVEILTKPYRQDDLTRKLRQLLDG